MRGFSNDFLTVVRTVKTKASFADKRLIRIPLESSCSLDSPVDGPGSPAPNCNEVSHTCITGKCQNASVGPAKHEIYTSDWPSTGDDPCKPVDHGLAEVIVGEGQSDFFRE